MTWIILLLALVLRLPLLTQSLWLDEAIQALALMGKQGALLTYALGDYQPPLYHLLGYVWTQLAGYSELSLRSISLIAGLLTVFYLSKIGKDFFSDRVGWIVGILSATNPLLIYYSQEGRTYALTAFLVTASMYYYLHLLRVRSYKHYILYFVFSTLFLWTSYLSWFFFSALVLYTLYLKRYDLVKLQFAAALTLVLWLPSLATSLNIGNSTRGNSPEWGRVVGGLSWKSLPLTWVKFVLGRISFVNKLIYALVVMVIGLLHLFVLKNISWKKHFLLLLWLLAPIILGVLVATVLPVFQYFRVLFALPAYLLLLAIGLAKTKNFALFSVLFATQLGALFYFWFSPHLHREDWRSLVADFPRHATVAMPSRAQSAPLRYYSYDQPIIEPSHESLTTSPVYYIRYVEDLFDTNKAGAKNFVDSGYTITSQKVYAGLQVDIYENRP